MSVTDRVNIAKQTNGQLGERSTVPNVHTDPNNKDRVVNMQSPTNSVASPGDTSNSVRPQLSTSMRLNSTAATDILPLDKDLKDWLEFTKWNDIDYRMGYLNYQRTSRIVMQKKADLAAEEAKLREFEGKYPSEFAGHIFEKTSYNPAPTSFSCLPDHSTHTSEGNGACSIQQQHDNLPNYTLEDRFTQDGGIHNEMLHSEDEQLRAATPSTSTAGYASPLRYDDHGEVNRAHNTDRSRSHSRSRSPMQGSKSQWARARNPVKYENNMFTERRAYREERANNYKPLELGRPGDTRFFIIRSYNMENVEDSKVDGLWASKHDNAKKLVDAFHNCRNVILIFGVNSSREFQGYARMIGIPSAELPKPRWHTKITWPISQPYQIEWICKKAIQNSQFHGLKNSLNEDLAVTRSRDCQELDDYCGRGVIAVFDSKHLSS